MATFTGTAGNDVMQLSHDGLQYNVLLNGQFAGSTTDSSIIMQGLGGADQINILKLKPGLPGQLVTVRGGAGNDTIRVANGNLIRDIDDGQIIVEELAGEGNDSLFIDDNGTGAHAPLEVRSTTYTAALLSDTSSITFDQNTEVKQFNFSAQNDSARVFTVPVGMRLMMGDGNNTVIYGGTGLVIEGNPPVGHVEGGAGDNLVIFNDQNASTAGPREYLITSTGLTNQTFSNIDDLELNVRYGDQSGNLVTILDDAGIGREIRLRTATEFGAGNDLQLGTESSPVDLATFAPDLNVDLEVFGICRYAITEQSQTPSGDPFVLRTAAGEQIITKGDFQARFTSDGSAFEFAVNGGSANDSFAIDDLLPESRITLNGGEGDDVVYQTISARPSALDLIFRGDFFFVVGGDGDDRLLLDDSQANIGAGLSSYRLGSAVSKDDQLYVSTDLIEEITLNADAGNNTIRFSTEAPDFYDPPDRYQLRGGGGDDTFTNESPTTFSGGFERIINATILGQAGNDTLDLDDSLNATFSGRDFTIAPNEFTFNLGFPGEGAIVLDNTLERLNFTDGDASSDVFLEGKHPSAAVLVNLGGGDDEITVGGGDLDSSGLLSSSVTIGGALGDDTIIFDDRLDSSGDGVTSTYAMNDNSIAKGGPSLLYGSFDFQTLLVANFAVPGQLEVIPTVNLNAVATVVDQTTITGGTTRGCFVNVATGNLQTIAGIVNVNFATRLTVNDINASVAPSAYEITGTQIRKTSTSQLINYLAVGSIVLDASSVNDTINIRRTAVATPVTVNGNNGSDAFTLGDGDISSNLFSPVTLNGGAGTNTLTINNSIDATPATQTLTTTTFSDVQTHAYGGMASLTLNEGAGGTDLAVNSVNIPATINGGAGDDDVNIGGGNLNNNLLANVTVNGNGGNDELHVRDQDTTGGRSHAFTTLTQYQFGTTGRTINFNAVEAASLQCGSGNDTVEVLLSNIPITLHTGGEFSPPITFPQGDTLRTGVFGPATVILAQTDTVLNLSVGQGVLRIPSGVVLNRVTPAFDLGVNIGGTIDLGGALLFRAGSVTPDIRTLLTRGHNGGAWNGTNTSGAINSSSANSSAQSDGVGYGLGSEIAVTSIGGFTVAAGDTLIRYTLNGDADLNSAVNISDFARLAANFNAANKIWTTADSNYDGLTNISDFSALAANFNQSVPGGLPRSFSQMQQGHRFSNRLIEDIFA